MNEVKNYDNASNFLVTDGEIGTGWTHFPCDVPAMVAAIDFALETYRSHQGSWQKLMLSGMGKDLSWDRAARQYEQIFEWALMDPPVRHN